jgi:tyrosyl-tRNA synthetase
MNDQSAIDSALSRGVVEVIGEDELRKLLAGGKPLRLKMGFDPTAPDIHFGHVVGLRKLRQFQDMGHTVVLIIADWTARIGDPSGQSVTRPMLTAEQVKANAETYLVQFFKVVDKARTEVRWQSEWFADFSLTDVVELTSRFTVAQFLAREDFSERFKNQKPIAITEFLYPLLQAYDSVMVKADVEFGGTDQKFNLLVGRDLQGMMAQRPQNCLLVPILPGTDGVRKMSKSLNNYIGVDEPPADMYGKTMSLPDELVGTFFELLTDVPDSEVASIKATIEAGATNPMDLKKRLARTLVMTFYDEATADESQANFERTVQAGQAPEDVPEVSLPPLADRQGKRLSAFLVDAGLAGSGADAKRLIEQRAVSLDGTVLESNITSDGLTEGVLKVGKRQFARLIEAVEP